MYIFSLLFEINFFIDDSDHSCSHKEQYAFPMLSRYWYNRPLSPNPFLFINKVQRSTCLWSTCQWSTCFVMFIIKYNIFVFDKQQYTLRKLIVIKSFHMPQFFCFDYYYLSFIKSFSDLSLTCKYLQPNRGIFLKPKIGIFFRTKTKAHLVGCCFDEL